MKFGIWELVVILLIVALLFGTKKLRSIGSDLGNALKGFRNAMRDDDGSASKDSTGQVVEGEKPEQAPRDS
jgi:sec-independent protein translocase protein TatA